MLHPSVLPLQSQMVTGGLSAAWRPLVINPIIGSDEIRDPNMLRFVSYGVQVSPGGSQPRRSSDSLAVPQAPLTVPRLRPFQVTLDTYSHVTARLQEAAARSFDQAFPVSYNGLARESWLAIG